MLSFMPFLLAFMPASMPLFHAHFHAVSCSLNECHTGRAGWGHGGSDLHSAAGPATGRRPVAGAPPVVDPPDAGALLAAIEVVASFVSTCEAARYDGDDAASLVAAFSRGKRLCAAGETLVAARAAECHAHLSLGHRSPADWLASVTGASVGEAADVLKVGEALPSQPGVEAALRGGKLTPSRAKLVTGAVRRNPQKEAELVRGAEADTFRQLKDRCLRARAEGRRAEDADAAHAAVHAARRCRTWTDEEGAFRLDALLTPEAGASLLASLTRQSDRFFRASRTAGVHEPSEAYAADALVALVTGRGLLPASRSGAGPKGDNPEAGDPRGGDSQGGDPRAAAGAAARVPPSPGPWSRSGWTWPPCAGGRWPTGRPVRSPASAPSRCGRPPS